MSSSVPPMTPSVAEAWITLPMQNQWLQAWETAGNEESETGNQKRDAGSEA